MRNLLVLLTIAVGAALAPLVAQGGGGVAMGFLGVSAVMQPSAVLLLDLRPLDFSITAADIERGYIDVPAASFVRVSAGQIVPQVVLEFDPSAGPFKSLSLRSVPAKAAGGGTAAPDAPAHRVAQSNAATLGYRLLLADNASRSRPSIPLVLSISL